jgi:DNA primase
VAPIPAREDKLPGYCVSIVSDFIDRDLLREKRSVMGTMQRLDATADPERYAEVQRELVRIETERRVLRNE